MPQAPGGGHEAEHPAERQHGQSTDQRPPSPMQHVERQLECGAERRPREHGSGRGEGLDAERDGLHRGVQRDARHIADRHECDHDDDIEQVLAAIRTDQRGGGVDDHLREAHDGDDGQRGGDDRRDDHANAHPPVGQGPEHQCDDGADGRNAGQSGGQQPRLQRAVRYAVEFELARAHGGALADQHELGEGGHEGDERAQQHHDHLQALRESRRVVHSRGIAQEPGQQAGADDHGDAHQQRDHIPDGLPHRFAQRRPRQGPAQTDDRQYGVHHASEPIAGAADDSSAPPSSHDRCAAA